MIVLAIDTAGVDCAAAVFDSDTGAILGRVSESIGRGHAERLMAMIDEALAEAKLLLTDVVRIGVTIGPGSFTGLRIGLSAARGLGLALGIPVVGVPSLQAISLYAKPGHPTAVLLDARRGEAYVQRFFGPGKPWDGPLLLPMGDALRLAEQVTPTPITTPFCDIGELAGYAADLTPSLFPPEASYVRSADAKPQDGARIARQGAA